MSTNQPGNVYPPNPDDASAEQIVVEILFRALRERPFREWLETQPEEALADYPLPPHLRQILITRGQRELGSALGRVGRSGAWSQWWTTATPPPPTSSYQIYLVGLGILGSLQVTREAEDALRACRKVFFLHTEGYVQQYIRSLAVEVEHLGPQYSEGEPRALTYERMADLVLQSAEEDPPVSLAVYGHPLLLVTPSRLLRERALERGLRVKAVPGVSAIDCLIVDLDLDPGEQGLVMYEANFLLVHRPELDPTVPCLVWQAGAVGTRVHTSRPSRPERFDELRDYLLDSYGAGHMVALAVSATSPLVDPDVVWVPLRELAESHDVFSGLTTLFVPPVRRRDVADQRVQTLLDDPGHLSHITLE
jgi:tetrapyrrole methylase family protein/MazG family protein